MDMHDYNDTFHTSESNANCWNSDCERSVFASNISSGRNEYYESKFVFEDRAFHQECANNPPGRNEPDCVGDAISFLRADTSLLTQEPEKPVSIRVVWNQTEDISRVFLPNGHRASVNAPMCLSVKGDPYGVREFGVMLDTSNYVRMLLPDEAPESRIS
ncbi:hypothetical protein [Swaminathania salitolerans]|nr:hypothetical protein [Swaminathania salitolerans]